MDVVAEFEQAAYRFVSKIMEDEVLMPRMRQALEKASLTVLGLYGKM